MGQNKIIHSRSGLQIVVVVVAVCVYTVTIERMTSNGSTAKEKKKKTHTQTQMNDALPKKSNKLMYFMDRAFTRQLFSIVVAKTLSIFLVPSE